jgi:hypothetical protein
MGISTFSFSQMTHKKNGVTVFVSPLSYIAAKDHFLPFLGGHFWTLTGGQN